MNVVFTCVTEPTKKYLDQSARLLMSLRWFGGSVGNARFVLGTTGPIPEEAAGVFRRYGAEVVIVERYDANHGPSNKVSLLKSPALAGHDVVVLIDCDTVIVQDPSRWLDVPGVAAKLADVHSVQLPEIERVFRHFGAPMPEARFTHELTGEANIAYCNSGVVIVNETHREKFAGDWDYWNRAVLEAPDSLAFRRYHVDQLSLALAIENSGIPFQELPAEMNMPVHLDEHYYPASWQALDPAIIHYHWLAYSNGFLKPNFLFQASQRMESFNLRLRAELSADGARRSVLPGDGGSALAMAHPGEADHEFAFSMAKPAMRATVIIPTCGRPVAIKGALRSLLANDPAKMDVEILVVDNNNDAGLSDSVRLACAEMDGPVRYAAEPSFGQTAARHLGAKEARGEVLIYVDDDVLVSSNWLAAFMRVFDDRTVGIAGGPSIPAFTGSVPPWFWDFLRPTPYGGWSCGWLSLLDIGESIEGIDPGWIWGLNFAIRKDILQQLGGFHPDLVPPSVQRWQGDGETGLAYRAKSSGVRCVYVQDALLHHLVSADRLTPEYFAKRAYYQGVCDSFTSIRAGAQPVAEPVGPRTMPPYPAEGAGPWAHAAHEIRVRAMSSYNEGWIFHQKEAAMDPALLQWIRRPDYWSADICDELANRLAVD